MKTLREYIKEASEKKIAIGHFNISNLETLHGIYNAAKKIGVPVIIGVSQGEEDFMGCEEVAVLIKTIRERDNFPIFLNADHHHSFDSFKKSIDAGFDAAIIDKVELPIYENIEITKKCVEYAKEISLNTSRDILVEAELGFIGTSSKILDKIPEGIDKMTDKEEAKYFIENTGIDMFSPSVGNIHGLVKDGNPRLDINRISEIKNNINVPMVLHGGSGIKDEDIKQAIQAGISVIHINTEIRVAYKEALEKFLKEHPNEIAPYKILQSAVEEVEKVVENKLKLFNNLQ